MAYAEKNMSHVAQVSRRQWPGIVLNFRPLEPRVYQFQMTYRTELIDKAPSQMQAQRTKTMLAEPLKSPSLAWIYSSPRDPFELLRQ